VKTTLIGMLLSPFLLTAQQNGGAWTGLTGFLVGSLAIDPKT
jgi:hypothetical protein